jgi:hypothetical protein
LRPKIKYTSCENIPLTFKGEREMKRENAKKEAE